MITVEQIELAAEELPAVSSTGMFDGYDCLVELKSPDMRTGIQYRECLIEYTSCSNQHCIKKLT